VTDADLVLGRIPAGTALPGLGALDLAAARAALDGAGVAAEGVVTVVNANMERALRAVSVERGVDPRSLALVAFGGAGPLHACELADALGMPRVIVPARAGVLSALGVLGAPRSRELVRSWSGDGSVDTASRELADEVRRLVGPGAVTETLLDVRYAGQSHELTVRSLGSFPEEHRRRNGYSRADAPLEIVALRARARIDSSLDITALPPIERPTPAGPAVIAEPDCTIWLPDGWMARRGEADALVLERR
jgi:N-methylhydantoinase A/oxoprolinase/acetone carboxylase beta subunit